MLGEKNGDANQPIYKPNLERAFNSRLTELETILPKDF
jgi:hypothetical protein